MAVGWHFWVKCIRFAKHPVCDDATIRVEYTCRTAVLGRMTVEILILDPTELLKAKFSRRSPPTAQHSTHRAQRA